ncbi:MULTISPECIES: ATP-binding protein [unclassified Marinimicrobium]|jgi:two-component system nitrate/nitrite sensor histidine kinase NarX|uniref:ATP-binding protein n=1 Tax=unclassified Marinimicrobium TaxID=2632100 RepID=UPI000C41858C|nr:MULTISPECIES: ATP-binding protein [unclassified Marinimicrobium]MAN50516.1 nitrate/nitrite two-component system sensor histidine kinase [Marinimicrobium sp.]
MRTQSLVLSIKLALAGIVALAALTMAASYWLSDRADSDAHAINLAGSLRMHTYHLLALEESPAASTERREQVLGQLESTWNHPLFELLRHRSPALEQRLETTEAQWRQLRTQLNNLNADERIAATEALVEQIDATVGELQRHAETNASLLRLVQVIALFTILALAAVVVYWLHLRVEQPLAELLGVTRRVSQGDYEHRLAPRYMDELGEVAESFNQMSRAIAYAHGEMEAQIAQQTRELQRSNTTLEFLYQTAQTIIEQEPEGIDFQPIITRAAEVAQVDDLELCLITSAGDHPYRQVKPEDSEYDICMTRNCGDCLSGELLSNAQGTGLPDPVYRYSFPMNRDQQHYGVLVCRMGDSGSLTPWQQQLLQSVADQIAMALSLQAEEDNARRLSLAHERTVIARELHDSLAQALSYLKIQVTRLNRALAKDDKQTLEDVSKELQEGLSSAYRQLRELLTTFRLKVDGPGLLGALQTSVKQLSAQTEMTIELDYQLESLPLTPNEEIHLLQIVREATQNALHHSQGQRVDIQIERRHNKVSVVIDDDGVGIPENPEKLNHYGMAIMQERSKNLGGEVTIGNRTGGGTRVQFLFTPDCLRQAGVFAREA